MVEVHSRFLLDGVDEGGGMLAASNPVCGADCGEDAGSSNDEGGGRLRG
jgi:hypothetical protein